MKIRIKTKPYSGRRENICRLKAAEGGEMLRRKKERQEDHAWDGQQPAMKSSICTGETVAGFLDSGGKFHEIMLISGEKDLALFCRRYGVKKEEIRHIF